MTTFMCRPNSCAHNLFWSQNEEKPTSTVEPDTTKYITWIESFRTNQNQLLYNRRRCRRRRRLWRVEEVVVAVGPALTCGGPGPARPNWVGPWCRPGEVAPETPRRCLSRPLPLRPSTSAPSPPQASLACKPLESARLALISLSLSLSQILRGISVTLGNVFTVCEALQFATSCISVACICFLYFLWNYSYVPLIGW